MPGKTVSGNLRILNREMLTNATLAVNLLLSFKRINEPNETIVRTNGAHVHKKVDDIDKYDIFFM